MKLPWKRVERREIQILEKWWVDGCHYKHEEARKVIIQWVTFKLSIWQQAFCLWSLPSEWVHLLKGGRLCLLFRLSALLSGYVHLPPARIRGPVVPLYLRKLFMGRQLAFESPPPGIYMNPEFPTI